MAALDKLRLHLTAMNKNNQQGLPMRNLFYIFLFSALITGCGGSGSNNQPADTPPSTSSSTGLSSASSTSIAATSGASSSSLPAATLVQKLDAYLAANIPTTQPGVSVLVAKNGKLSYSGGRGMADIPANISVTSNTGFRLASVSKSFTAIAVMQLVEKGELKLTDHLVDYLPELPTSWSQITIEHLLTHKSGIYDIINDWWPPTDLQGLTHATLVNYLLQNPALEFAPGSACDYSNTGYMLLVNVIEKKTGMSFSNYMQQNIFGPAGMTGSYITDESQPIKPGDALNRGQSRSILGLNIYLKGSMAQVSSVNDFFNFFEALRNNTLMSAQTKANILTAHGKLRGYNIGYGYGFIVEGDYIGHSGDWDGFQTEMGIIKSTGVEFAILTNSGSRTHIEGLKKIIFGTEF
jgi:D-alanyl-D-alanine carboxypeptidase